jgi:prepilin-type N-terminal cleavage/methylation domain-containing protein
MKETTSLKSKGFTLLELLISVGILSLLMLTTSTIFVRSFSSYQSTKELENSITDAQFLMNLLAKELRTSTVVSPSSSGTTSSITFFEYSKSQCIQYRFSGERLEVARANAPDVSSCSSGSVGSFSPVGLSSISGSFTVVPSRPSGPQRVGQVTMSMSVDAGDAGTVDIQTTTSLRDYGYVGLQ